MKENARNPPFGPHINTKKHHVLPQFHPQFKNSIKNFSDQYTVRCQIIKSLKLIVVFNALPVDKF